MSAEILRFNPSVLTTDLILEATQASPLHLLPAEDLDSKPISSKSLWGDDAWALDNRTSGASGGGSTIRWAVEMLDGSLLTDPANKDMLDWLKRLVWSVLSAPGDGAHALKPGSLGTLGAGVRWLAPWLAGQHVRRPSEITITVIDALIDELKAEAEESDEGATGLTYNPVYYRLMPFGLLWRQRFALEAAGYKPMPAQPFGGRGVDAVALSIAKAGKGQYMPLPDEVALPVLNAAWRMLGAPADDIIDLQQACFDAHDREPGTYHTGDGTSAFSRMFRQRKAAEAFRFAVLDGETAPWHPPLQAQRDDDAHVGVMQRVRQLVLHLRSACCMVIQATTGMRISEICALQAGIDPETGLPSSVAIQPSDSGLAEHFIVKSKLSKTEETPRDVEWTLGSRPTGTDILPPAVQAILILNRLLSPYRSLRGTNDLLVNFSKQRGLPRSAETVGRVTSNAIRNGYKDFIEEWVDLSGLPDNSQRKARDNDLVEYRETKGRCIKTHQLRKLFANYAIRVDRGLLSAIQMHFHHVSQAMTDGGYVMADRALLTEMNDIKEQMVARTLFETALDESADLAGRHGEEVADMIMSDLKPRLAGLTTKEAFEATYAYVEDNDIHWNFEMHGICGALAASKMACHVNGGTDAVARWSPVLRPNYRVREPSMCAGCASFVVARQHLPFWSARYVETAAAIRNNEKRFPDDPYEHAWAVGRQRVDQARAICRRIGADLDALDREVEDRVLEMENEQVA